MDTAAELHKHAAACATMAKVSHDPEARAEWERMAERWFACAKRAEEEDLMLRRRAEENRSEPRRRPQSALSPQEPKTGFAAGTAPWHNPRVGFT